MKQVLPNLQTQKRSQSQSDMQKDTNGQIVTDLRKIKQKLGCILYSCTAGLNIQGTLEIFLIYKNF